MILTTSIHSEEIFLAQVETKEEAFAEMRRFLEVNHIKSSAISLNSHFDRPNDTEEIRFKECRWIYPYSHNPAIRFFSYEPMVSFLLYNNAEPPWKPETRPDRKLFYDFASCVKYQLAEGRREYTLYDGGKKWRERCFMIATYLSDAAKRKREGENKCP